MNIRFIGQPFREWNQVGDVLSAALHNDAHTRLWAAVAWTKRSGLRHLVSDLAEFRARGGRSELILGVDEGGATWEGLQMAMQLFDQPFVFHDPGNRTFHSKLCVVEGDEQAVAILGSSNFTKGGLYTNYESAAIIEIERSQSAGQELLDHMRTYFDALRHTPHACRPLTRQLADDMVAQTAIVISSEGRQRPGRGEYSSHVGASLLFGRPVRGLLHAPGPSSHDASDTDSTVERAQANRAPTTSEQQAAPSIAGFFKQLSANDVSKRGSPGQIIIPKAFLQFFGVLELQKDESDHGGPVQRHKLLTVHFRDGRYSKTVDTARVVLYEPAANHPRPNSEVRFTFRDQTILQRLKQGDVLLFTRPSSSRIVVQRHPAGWRPQGRPASQRYGTI